MSERRVVITGMGAVSPFGWGIAPMLDGMMQGKCALSLMRDDERIEGIKTRVAGRSPDFNARVVPREYRRAMSHMSIMSLIAANEALKNAGIEPGLPLAPEYSGMGCSISSTVSSTISMEDFFRSYLIGKNVDEVRSTIFFKIMSHAVPSNLSVSLGLTGRCLSASSACAGALQSIGLAYESIRFGRETRMICGGAEEFHPLFSATFDRLGAATHSEDPDSASRPFDNTRDGIVCSEGAGILVLEEYESAKARGARIWGEIAGFGTNASPLSIISPDAESITGCMKLALDDAGVDASGVALVNAHATATEHGDIAEGAAIYGVFGKKVAVNSLKGYMGHAMAASGALELISCLCAAREGKILGTRNLASPDPRCGDIDIFASHRPFGGEYILKNSFGLGGVNASLLVKMI